MNIIRFRLELSPRPPSWNLGFLLLRAERERGKSRTPLIDKHCVILCNQSEESSKDLVLRLPRHMMSWRHQPWRHQVAIVNSAWSRIRITRQTVFTVTVYSSRWFDLVGNIVGRINEVNQRQARLVLGWVTVGGRVSHPGMWPPRSTQPGHPSLGRHSRYRRMLGRKQTHRAIQ